MRLLLRLVVLVLVTGAVAVTSLLLLPADRIASVAADQISRQTGRAVTLSGDTRITLWPVLGIATERVEIANAPWSEAGPMLRAENLKIGVAPQALWGGAVRITGLEVKTPEIRLERAADGQANWALGVEGVAPSGQGDGTTPGRVPRLALTLDRALISDATLSYVDHGTGHRRDLRGLDLDLRWPDPDAAATISAELDALAGPGRIALSGQLDPARALIEGGRGRMTARLSAPGGTLDFAGAVSARPEAQGTLTAALEDTARALAALGLGTPDIPAGLGRRAEISAQVSLTADRRVALRDTVMTLDGNRVTGEADLDLSGAVPQLRAQINAAALELPGAGRGGGADTGRARSPDGWSMSPIDAGALAWLEGEVALVADSIALGALRLGTTRSRATLTRSRLVLDLVEVALHEGRLTGEFVVNNRSGLSVGGDLLAEGVSLQPLLRDTLGLSRLQGRAEARLQFLGVGQSIDSIMRSLSGSGSVNAGRGVIDGIDLDRLMRSGDATGGTTVFDSLSGSFTMADGALRNEDLLMTLPRARAEGRGRVGLGARDIDYLFTPVLAGGNADGGLAIPVRIEGPWRDPRIRPDLAEAVDRNLQEEREQIESRARERLGEELGVTIEDGASAEDVLRDTLEKELGDGLRRLFD